jgi:hypothetical protein
MVDGAAATGAGEAAAEASAPEAAAGAALGAAGGLHGACAALAGGFLVACLLAGCATSTTPGPRTGVGRGASAGEDGASPAAVNRVRGRGGYYLDDGPGDRDPAELDALARLPDPVPLVEPLHPRANRPYRVMGGDYRPMTQRAPFPAARHGFLVRQEVSWAADVHR